MTAVEIPDWITYPDEEWASISPEDAGLDAEKFQSFLDSLNPRGAAFAGEDHTGGRWGAVLTRGGYLLHEWGEKWLRKSEQGDKWNRCLIEGMIVLSETGARDEQTTPP